ncbi:alpha/beta-hydrolase [Aureobasidium subglaciale]|nr:alpha/beta-hydrolase [Aureobasidium subglaciale]KAI5217939.1 alpha/beta-hydrolase [Aureobasidium subglaciale]KAI5221406.1 alpha/beta-hydrolase [Aureobasidium subglaciale]KAI5258993.1 alpha/beta-hydrolase [Aureobasidium subglaciale]
MRSSFDLLVRLLALSPLAVEPATATRRDRPQEALLLPLPPIPIDNAPLPTRQHDFTLRHIYHKGSHQYPNLLRKVDITPDVVLDHVQDGEDSEYAATVSAVDSYRVNSGPMTIERLADRRRSTIDRLLEAGQMRGEAVSLPASSWTMDELDAPNITDKETVLAFARMASNAYVLVPHTGDWVDVGGGFNYTEDFGWESDGLRGHIFADTTNKTVVIGLKGTSPAVFDGADTTGNDKLNDNLFGSCCCGSGGQPMWKIVCDCQTSAFTCNSTCLVKSLRNKAHYYQAAQELYHNVTELYPDADVWLTGHSLGGVVTSLLGLTFGLPTITFETFPEALAASRLGLPTPPGYHIGDHKKRPHTGAYHFGHTADPIYSGTCNTAFSGCTIGGYAFQGKCHTGSSCTYDTVKDFGWRQGIGTHKISSVIHDVILKYDTVPTCEKDEDCIDCYEWKFFESNGTETTTSSSSTAPSTTRTRTETCKTPGWWGCLDESTSSLITVPVTTTETITTTTCLSPGWFGCKDEVTTTETTTVTSSIETPAPAPTVTTTSAARSSSSPHTSSASSTTCKSPGWFGCHDSTTTTKHHATSTLASSTSTTEHECTSKEWFGFICVDPSATQSKPKPTSSHRKCVRRNYVGKCKEWNYGEGSDDKTDL